MIKLSNRLSQVAALVPTGAVLADVGTDHGYIPIALVQEGRIERALAMDIGKGPLERAKEHIALHQLTGRIETRLSDGLMGLKEGEADCVVIAGMGGGLVLHILETGGIREKGIQTLVLQPQSEISRVRAYLEENAYEITAEDMVYEDGKYYPMMQVKVNRIGDGINQKTEAEKVDAKSMPHRFDGQGMSECQKDADDKNASELNKVRMHDANLVGIENEKQIDAERRESNKKDFNEMNYRYGSLLIQSAHPVLKQFLEYEHGIKTSIAEDLKKKEKNAGILARLTEIEYDISINELAQKMIMLSGEKVCKVQSFGKQVGILG